MFKSYKKFDVRIVDSVLVKSWEYLDKNFHKFSTKQKIYVAVEIMKKSMPDKLQHSGTINVDMNVYERIKQARENVNNALGREIFKNGFTSPN